MTLVDMDLRDDRVRIWYIILTRWLLIICECQRVVLIRLMLSSCCLICLRVDVNNWTRTSLMDESRVIRYSGWPLTCPENNPASSQLLLWSTHVILSNYNCDVLLPRQSLPSPRKSIHIYDPVVHSTCQRQLNHISWLIIIVATTITSMHRNVPLLSFLCYSPFGYYTELS